MNKVFGEETRCMIQDSVVEHLCEEYLALSAARLQGYGGEIIISCE